MATIEVRAYRLGSDEVIELDGYYCAEEYRREMPAREWQAWFWSEPDTDTTFPVSPIKISGINNHSIYRWSTTTNGYTTNTVTLSSTSTSAHPGWGIQSSSGTGGVNTSS